MIKCIAIDDEPLSLDQLKRYIHRIPELQLVGTAYTVSQAKEILSKEKADLLFLDIEMPGESGVDFAKSLLEKYESLSVVFTTAYSQYAIEGFRVDAVDYLLKPLDFNELQIAVDKVKRRIRDNLQHEAENAANNTLFIKASGMTYKIHITDIVYIKGLSEYVQINVIGEQKHITTYDSLKHFEDILPSGKFMRIHKSYIINLAFFESADSDTVIVNGTQLPIGQKYRKDFKQYLLSR